LGLGPSAHSYNFVSRQWNISNISNYIDSIEKTLLPFEGETLSLIQQYDEYILTSLRTIWGIDEFEILNKYGKKYYDYFKQQIETYIQKAWVERNGNIYTLTKQGKYFADGIASELFITTD
jgi:oxygen-independent coproporphyrinogen-3 oxidase